MASNKSELATSYPYPFEKGNFSVAGRLCVCRGRVRCWRGGRRCRRIVVNHWLLRLYRFWRRRIVVCLLPQNHGSTNKECINTITCLLDPLASMALAWVAEKRARLSAALLPMLSRFDSSMDFFSNTRTKAAFYFKNFPVCRRNLPPMLSRCESSFFEYSKLSDTHSGGSAVDLNTEEPSSKSSSSLNHISSSSSIWRWSRRYRLFRNIEGTLTSPD